MRLSIRQKLLLAFGAVLGVTLATGAVILVVSPFNYLAVGILAGLVWMFVFCYWVLNPHHMSPMVSWYFNSKARQARPVQLELPLSGE